MTPAEKKANTLEIRLLEEHLNALMNEVRGQYPQPNGDIYYFGLPITIGRVNQVINEINGELRARNMHRKEKLHLYQTVTYLNKRTFIRAKETSLYSHIL